MLTGRGLPSQLRLRTGSFHPLILWWNISQVVCSELCHLTFPSHPQDPIVCPALGGWMNVECYTSLEKSFMTVQNPPHEGQSISLRGLCAKSQHVVHKAKHTSWEAFVFSLFWSTHFGCHLEQTGACQVNVTGSPYLASLFAEPSLHPRLTLPKW